MKHPIDEINQSTYKSDIEKASEIFKSRRDQILALNTFSGFQYFIDYWKEVERICLKNITSCPVDSDDGKINLHTARGAYNIAKDFLTYIENLQKSKDRE